MANANLRCPKCGNRVSNKGHARGKTRYWCKPCDWHGTNPIGLEASLHDGIDLKRAETLHEKVRRAKGIRRYVVTAAQNATPVFKPFFQSLKRYCARNKAQLLVIPYRYKNPTSMWTADDKSQDWWDSQLAPYIVTKRLPINDHLMILGDIMTQPTAVRPLEGFETLIGAKSAVIGHPKLELITVPTPQSKLPKILTTTGAVTVKNYIEAKAGKKAEHHHTYGACLLEVNGDKFHVRQLNALSDGSFMDLDKEYSASGIRKGIRIAGLVMGDLHEEFKDPLAIAGTFGPGGIVPTLKPRYLVWHDVHDFYSQNHHHKHEVFIKYAKHHSGANNVERALDRTFAFIDEVTKGRDVKNVFVPSNHPDALARWIKETDPRTDPENCVFWAKTFEVMCEASTMTAGGARTIDPFAYWAQKKLKTASQAIFLERDQSFLIQGIETGFHGDKGSNGGKGSLKGYSKLGVKTVTGHGHAPGICEGAYRVGTKSRLKLDYTSGPSSWLHTDCIIYENGKRSLVSYIDGEWRAK